MIDFIFEIVFSLLAGILAFRFVFAKSSSMFSALFMGVALMGLMIGCAIVNVIAERSKKTE